MKTTTLFILGCPLLFAACTADSFNETAPQTVQTVANNNAAALISKLANRVAPSNAQSQEKQTLQGLIAAVETQAFADADFVQLLTADYTTPQAADIEAVLADADGVLNNLDFSATTKSYIGSILNTTKATDVDNLVQTITIGNQLTAEEKVLLYDLADLQKEHLLSDDGDDRKDDSWKKNEIIGYAQGYHQTKANAVLNAVIIQVLAQP